MMKRSASHSGSWAIGELAKATGVSTDTFVITSEREYCTHNELAMIIASIPKMHSNACGW